MPAPVIAAIIAGGASVGAAAIASHGNTSAANTNANASDKAAQIQADTSAKALAQAKEIYQQQRADEGPYRESGYGAVNALNFGLGLPSVSYQAPPASTSLASLGSAPPTHVTQGGLTLPDRTRPPDVPSQGTAIPRPTDDTVRVLNPKDGKVYPIPRVQLTSAIADGGQVVS